jgi:hypothetical protein
MNKTLGIILIFLGLSYLGCAPLPAPVPETAIIEGLLVFKGGHGNMDKRSESEGRQGGQDSPECPRWRNPWEIYPGVLYVYLAGPI